MNLKSDILSTPRLSSRFFSILLSRTRSILSFFPLQINAVGNGLRGSGASSARRSLRRCHSASLPASYSALPIAKYRRIVHNGTGIDSAGRGGSASSILENDSYRPRRSSAGSPSRNPDLHTTDTTGTPRSKPWRNGAMSGSARRFFRVWHNKSRWDGNSSGPSVGAGDMPPIADGLSAIFFSSFSSSFMPKSIVFFLPPHVRKSHVFTIAWPYIGSPSESFLAFFLCTAAGATITPMEDSCVPPLLSRPNLCRRESRLDASLTIPSKSRSAPTSRHCVDTTNVTCCGSSQLGTSSSDAILCGPPVRKRSSLDRIKSRSHGRICPMIRWAENPSFRSVSYVILAVATRLATMATARHERRDCACLTRSAASAL